MQGSARAGGTAVLVLLLLALSLPVPASADGGCGAPGRPACTVLRPRAPIPVRGSRLGAPDCVVQIGGLGSTVDSTARAFEDLRVDGVETSILDFDALGQIAAAAEALRAHVERIRDGCASIHLIAHSMGGTVADRAFSKGLSSADGIRTYIPLASPHNGSALARRLCGVEGVDPDYTELLRSVAGLLSLPDPTSEAVCDLARVDPPRPPRGVETTRLRLVTDALVLRGDHHAAYFDVRELLPLEAAEAEGHGGILVSAQAREIVLRSIERGEVPADDRGDEYRLAAAAASHAAEHAASVAHDAVADVVWSGAVLARIRALVDQILGELRNKVVLAGPHVLSYLSLLPTVGSGRFDR